MAKERDRVTPYFDLFDRLGNADLARLAGVKESLVAEIREIVEAIYDPLREYENLLEQLDDRQVSKLFGMPESAARIWRLARAPKTLSAAERTAPGVLDPIMGDSGDDDDDGDDDDLLIVVDDPAPEEAEAADGENMDWSDL